MISAATISGEIVLRWRWQSHQQRYRRFANRHPALPYGVFNEMSGSYDGIAEQYVRLATELGRLGLGYLHLVDHTALGAPESGYYHCPRHRQGDFVIMAAARLCSRVVTIGNGPRPISRKARQIWWHSAGRSLPIRILWNDSRTGASLTVPDQATFYTSGKKVIPTTGKAFGDRALHLNVAISAKR
jgi:hypothetical protein